VGARAEAKQKAVEAYARELTKRKPHLGAVLRVLSYAIPHWWALGFMVLGMMVYAGCHQGKFFVTKPFVDNVVMDQSAGFWGRLWFVTIALALVAVAEAFARVLGQYAARLVQYRTGMDIQRRLFKATLDQEMTFFGRWQLGDMLQRMADDVNVTLAALDLILDDLVVEPFMIIGGAAVALTASWQLCIIAVVVLVFVVFPLVALGGKIRKQATKRQNFQARLNQTKVQMVTGFKTIKTFGREEHETGRFFEQTADLLRKALRVARSKLMSEGAVTLFAGITLAVIAFLGMAAVHEEIWGLTTGSLLMFVAGVQAMFRSVKTLAKAYNKVNESLAGSVRVFSYLDSMEAPVDRSGRSMDGIEPSVAFENVSFGYSEDVVLDNVSFTARAGQVTALVGSSGGGKTTILDLVARLYRPSSGRIRVGGVDINDVARDSYLADVAAVPQDPFLFATTIRENIKYGRLDATDEEMFEAARVANIHDFIALLPEGYDTVVGERGQTLSGGQRQRVATARAVLKNADILLLDEATSALDAESERAFYDALEKLMFQYQKTVLIVAHRLSTVVKADRILVLDSGRIVEEGTHTELMGRGGPYRRLFEAQFRDSGDDA